jgi:hypothetical protein
VEGVKKTYKVEYINTYNRATFLTKNFLTSTVLNPYIYMYDVQGFHYMTGPIK